MQIKGFSIIIFLICNFYISLSGFGQKIITGKVLNVISKLPVENVAVSVFKGTATTTTNSQGYFQLTITEEDSLVFTHPDYKSGGLKPPNAEVFIIYIEQYNYYPTYLDGDSELYKYLKKELKYPRKAFNKGIEGIVFVELQIDSAGMMVGCKSLNELCKNCEEHIIKVFNKIPGKWTGCEEPLVKHLIFPVVFKLNSWSEVELESQYKLPGGKLMSSIILTASQSKAPTR
jgi:hypothetical protein